MQILTNQLVNEWLKRSLNLWRICSGDDIQVQVACKHVSSNANIVSRALLTISHMSVANHVLDSIFTQEAVLSQMVLGFVDYLLELVQGDGNVVLVCLALFRDRLRETFSNSPERGEMRRGGRDHACVDQRLLRFHEIF